MLDMEEDHHKGPAQKCQHLTVSSFLPKTYCIKGTLKDLLYKAKHKEQSSLWLWWLSNTMIAVSHSRPDKHHKLVIYCFNEGFRYIQREQVKIHLTSKILTSKQVKNFRLSNTKVLLCYSQAPKDLFGLAFNPLIPPPLPDQWQQSNFTGDIRSTSKTTIKLLSALIDILALTNPSMCSITQFKRLDTLPGKSSLCF